MRHAIDAAEPARYALLGLLLEGPGHGYDLARHFAPGSALGAVLRLGSSHLYALLGRLEKDGLIVGERLDAGAHPPRRVYHVTEAGRAAVLRWIDKPVERPREMLLDFPLKFYIARRQDPTRAARLVVRQRRLLVGFLEQMEREKGAPTERTEGAEDEFIALMRDGRIARTRASLDWLDHCAAALRVDAD
jgi:DNA-binding PadR family transcriptional regulator